MEIGRDSMAQDISERLCRCVGLGSVGEKGWVREKREEKELRLVEERFTSKGTVA